MPKTTESLSPMLEASDEDSPRDRPAALRPPLRRSRAVHGRSRKVQRTVGRRTRRTGSRKGSRLNVEARDALIAGAIWGAGIGAGIGFLMMMAHAGIGVLYWFVLIALGSVVGIAAELIDLADHARQQRRHRPVVVEPRFSHVVNRCTDHR